MSFSANTFSLRIVSVDYYMAPPNPDIGICYSNFQGGEVNEVPIVRVYGPTPSGQKTCMHLHGALPYLFVPCQDISLFKGDDTFMHTMSVYMERALSLSNTVSNRQHVHGCSLVRARRFYGYFSREELFVKIYLYYPHDVPRAASLLLGGSLFDKSIQPHESHIPFLLQFFMDYNLFGMGYLHISKIKFRNPVPDDFNSSSRCYQHRKYRPEGKPTGSASPDMPDDSSNEIHVGSDIWSSSTIPRDWFWQFPGDSFGSSFHTAHPIKRQSKCALEADATVDDIINQKFKMFSPLSHTGSDVKMVQSLVPIWEEENERTGGIGVKNIPPDPGKPLPEDVLKTLSHGFELPDKFMEFVEEMGSPVLYGDDGGSLQSLRPFVEDTTTREKGKFKVDFYEDDVLGCCNVKSSSESVLSHRILQEIGKGIKLHEKVDLYPLIDTGTPFGSDGSLNSMSTDQEALELLRWLASSQAEEDIHSDDDLVPETIISPIFGTTIDTIIENASKNYEIESQQECQDILDSVADLIDFQQIKEPDSLFVPCKNLVQKSVPRVGIPDCNLTSMVDTIKEKSQESPFRHSEILKPCDTVGRKPTWGSLPFYTSQEVDCVEAENFEDTLGGCSMRDLMRKRRCFQTDITEHKNFKKISVEETHTSDTFSFPKAAHFCMVTEQETTHFDSASSKPSFLKPIKDACSNGQFVRDSSTGSSRVVHDPRSSTYPHSVYCKLPLFYDGSEPFREKELGNCDENELLDITVADSPEYDYGCPKYDSIISENASLEHHCTGNKQDGGNNLFMPSNFVFNYEALMLSDELLCMKFCKKPPKIDLDDITRKTEAVTSLISDEVLPFFTHPGEKIKHGGVSNANQGDSGISCHYQNDGSPLYMLTPALSPPSKDRVYNWLLRDETDHFKDTHTDSFKGKSSDRKCVMPTIEIKSSYSGMISTSRSTDLTDSKNKFHYGKDISQISASSGKSNPTPFSQMGFKDPARVNGSQQLTLFSIEVQAESTGNMKANPLLDAINIIAIVVQEDYDSSFELHVIMRDTAESCTRHADGISYKVQLVSDEKILLENFVRIIWSFDPDILMGWDVQANSLGYLVERASHLGMNLIDLISRAPSQRILASRGSKDISNENLFFDTSFADPVGSEDATIDDEWGRTHASGIHVDGRIVLNIWRLMRSEIKLNMYTVENVAAATLRRKVPLIHNNVLTKWYSSGPSKARHRCVDYIMDRARLNLEIVNQHDLINRTSELARVFGIDFFSVLSRGSQYRVESMLLRLAHTQNYLAISPGKQQVASQPAMECMPLVMEPESGFYFDPVVVLDFQSLYPSIIIAYNLCFCTCLGKIIPPLSNQLGVSSFNLDSNALKEFRTKVLFTPNGVMYMPAEVRKGILPRLLEEILSTRLMVKQAMKKLDPSEHITNRIFNARQLALKLIANVTYGYTAAGFSGRMPCAELADSIVQCGRRTLETAISFVNNCEKWKARVVYGDTDSMFVLLKGRTVKEAFEIGGEIASAITAMNPNPVTLKMEKVYSPCLLLTKKRYVGYSYETVDQTDPVFDAKGIETVRRDTCPAVSKMMEKSLRLFFEHRDLSMIRSYLQRQWTKILSGRVSIQDFIFSKEVRLGSYSSRVGSTLPPAAIVALKAMSEDPRAEPRYAERVPYIVIHGSPGGRLHDMVVDPSQLLVADSPLRLNDIYYITKQIIPALQRVFGLLGADLNRWFSETPRAGEWAANRRHFLRSAVHKTRIDSYYLSKHCVLCGALVVSSLYLCDGCSGTPVSVATALTGRTAKLEREMHHLSHICRHCGGGDWVIESGVKCTSLACPLFFKRRKLQKELHHVSSVASHMGLYPTCLTHLL